MRFSRSTVPGPHIPTTVPSVGVRGGIRGHMLGEATLRQIIDGGAAVDAGGLSGAVAQWS